MKLSVTFSRKDDAKDAEQAVLNERMTRAFDDLTRYRLLLEEALKRIAALEQHVDRLKRDT